MTMIQAVVVVGVLAIAAAGASAATAAGPAPAVPAELVALTFPQQRTVDGYALRLHAPQVRSWPGFEQFTAYITFELTPPGATSPTFGTAVLTGQTSVDRDTRQVEIRSPKVSDVKFAMPVPPAHKAAIEHAVTRTSLRVPLDLFLAYVADEVLAGPPPAGLNTAPPPIIVRTTPAIVLFVNGKPVPSAVPSTDIEVMVNANWPVFRSPAGAGAYYLLDRDRWLTSARLEKGWKAATSLPAGFAGLPAAPEFADARKAVPLRTSSRPVPQVLFVDQPTELVVTDGKPALEAIPGTDGLQWVRNTESPLFKLGPDWYFLVAGRWFTAANLDQGPWRPVTRLPEAFAAIPGGHPRSAVRASVPGTIEARMAALEASLPTETKVKKGSPPTVEVTYAGAPKFEPIAGTAVARAVNTGFDVLMYQNRYYLAYSAAWYVADSPTGPWGATADVPAAFYGIPPSSPAYTVTDVKVSQGSGDEIVYSSTDTYAKGVVVVMGVPYYGTGWYYPPYYYGGIYYPYRGSYGHGSWYNPATGGYGSRSVWYGPYGGYSYTQGYNPRTGRYGYVETAWDSDEWSSFGETYNPRTGVGTQTERYYNEDSNRMETERTVERGDEWVKTERETDFDDGTQTVERSTSQGGSSEVQRTLEDGSISTERTFTTGDGDTYTSSGERSRGEGSTTITGAEGSVTTETQRQNGRSATSIEGSGGGQGVSVSGRGPGRTTIAESGTGDLYAGHNGNVYKKTEDGWESYENGGWTAANPESGTTRGTGAGAAPATTAGTQQRSAQVGARPQPAGGSYPSVTPDARSASQLDRDYAARQLGNQQFRQRAAGRSRGMGRRR